MKKTYYLTTAIAYASAIPHIGNVYEAILADAIVRFKRLDGYDVFFQTGTDEHGQKIENKAELNELSPKTYVDHISTEIKRIYKKVGVSYDQFVRTTDERHIKSVQAIFKQLYDQGDIYLGEYEGWYSIAEEAFKKDNVKLQTLCDYSHLLSAALNKKTISENQLEDLKTWRNNPSNWTPKED